MTELQFPRRRFAMSYAALVGLPLLGLVAILRLGHSLASSGAAALPSTAPPVAGLDVPLLIAQVVVIIVVARLAGSLLARLGQPRVVGEMAAGLLLGPSVLGALAPAFAGRLFPVASIGFLNALSQVGLVFFMFLVGLELDVSHVRRRGTLAVLASHASIVVPFLLGAVLSLALYPTLAPPGVRFDGFALFVGAAMSVTAFPVLARILTERGLAGSRLGALALACAAVDDVSAWCLLAGVVMLVRGTAARPLWLLVGGSVVYVAFMLTIGRVLVARAVARMRLDADNARPLIALVVVLVLASAFVTEQLGVHALFGAFLVGAIMPRDPALSALLRGRFEDVMVVLFLPLFFAVTGLRTAVGSIGGGAMWLLCALVTVTAILGKLGGTAVAARVGGLPWRDAFALGTLMNTRGLMELVILTVGLDIGVISPVLFAMMVLMALVTTVMTTPLLARLYPGEVADGAVLRRAS